MQKLKTLIVGDLHGKYDDAAWALEQPYNILFIGDYLDSFTETKENQINTLLLVLDAVEKDGDRVQALFGNHELSYTLDQRCSGWNTIMAAHVMHERMRMERLLENYIWLGDFLVTHAGVSRRLLKNHVDGEVTKQDVIDYLEDENSNFYQAGYARGGMAPVGSIFWCDWFQEFEPINGLKQVVGHSGTRRHCSNKGILTKGEGDSESYNVDCLDHVKEFLLVDEEGKSAQIIKKEDF